MQASKYLRFTPIRLSTVCVPLAVKAPPTGQHATTHEPRSTERLDIFLEGELGIFSFADVLQLVCTTGHSALVEVCDLAGTRLGDVQIGRGSLVAASFDGLEGLVALGALLRQEEGVYVARRLGVHASPDEDFDAPVSALLAQCAASESSDPTRATWTETACMAPFF